MMKVLDKLFVCYSYQNNGFIILIEKSNYARLRANTEDKYVLLD